MLRTFLLKCRFTYSYSCLFAFPDIKGVVSVDVEDVAMREHFRAVIHTTYNVTANNYVARYFSFCFLFLNIDMAPDASAKMNINLERKLKRI